MSRSSTQAPRRPTPAEPVNAAVDGSDARTTDQLTPEQLALFLAQLRAYKAAVQLVQVPTADRVQEWHEAREAMTEARTIAGV